MTWRGKKPYAVAPFPSPSTARHKGKTKAIFDYGNVAITQNGLCFSFTLSRAAYRPINWVHSPVLDRADDPFFAPLARLRPRGTRVFLGLIHNMDRDAGRVVVARKYLAEFGVAAFCGFGQMPPADMPRVLSDHLRAVEALASQWRRRQ